MLTILSLAGSDTTAAAITSILYHLMRYPAAYRKLMEEIDQAAESGLLSSPSIKYSQAVKLPYLNACIKEGMRLHPSVGLTIPRHVPRDGCEISGEWFPGKVRVGVNAAVVHRNKDIFGADADEFNPERWFGVDAANMDKHMFQVTTPTIVLRPFTNCDTVWWRSKNLYWEKCVYTR